MNYLMFFIQNIVQIIIDFLGSYSDCIIFAPFVMFVLMQVVLMFKLIVGASWRNG